MPAQYPTWGRLTKNTDICGTLWSLFSAFLCKFLHMPQTPSSLGCSLCVEGFLFGVLGWFFYPFFFLLHKIFQLWWYILQGDCIMILILVINTHVALDEVVNSLIKNTSEWWLQCLAYLLTFLCCNGDFKSLKLLYL